MNVNLDSFRAMAEGKYNLGSVVVTTDSATHEQQLVKADNHKYRKSLNVKPTSEENIKTRQVLSNLMKAHVQKLAGADLERDAGLRAELKQIDDILLGKDIQEPLKRSGALAGAFKAFDNFEARLLKTRAVTNRLRTANASKIEVDEVKVEPPKAEVKQGEVQPGGEAVTKTLKYYDGTSLEPVIVIEKASEKTIGEFKALLAASRDRETVTAEQEQWWDAHPEDMPKMERLPKAEDTARKLRKEDQMIIDLLTKKLTANELGRELTKNPSVAHAMRGELFGALKYLAKVQTTHVETQNSLPADQLQPLPAKTVSVKVYVDNANITTTTMDITLQPDGKLELALRGHRFELAYTAQEFGDLLSESSTVKPRNDRYFSDFDENSHARLHENYRESFCAWNGNAKSVDKADGDMVRMFPPDDSRGAEAQIVEILDKLRELNNRDPLHWGGSPHYGNEMPQLEPVRHSRFGNRTWAHIRAYCGKQIEKGGMHALFGRTLAKIQGVPLEAGQSCGLCETKFEKAVLFLNKVRALALNVNWIMSQFENLDGESDNDAINRVCTAVSDICQLQLHPNEGLTMHSKEFLQQEIRTLIRSTLKGYEVALQKNNLPEYFTALAAGACFQGCVTYVSEFLDQNGSAGLSQPVSVYPAEVRETVKRQLEDKVAAVKGQIADLDNQLLDVEGAMLGLEGDAKVTEGPKLQQQKVVLERRKGELGKQLKFWESREIGTGALFMKNGQVVLERLSEKEKSGKSAAKAQKTSLEWSPKPSFIDEVLSPLMHDIYREIKFGDKKDMADKIGKPPFHLPKVDMMVDLIVERFAQLARVAAEKGVSRKRPELERELAKLEAERDNLKAALEQLKVPDGKSTVKFLELIQQHGERAGELDAKTRELKDSAAFKARTDKINAETDKVKMLDGYKSVMAKIEAKTREVEASDAYLKLVRELEDQIKVLEGSKHYLELSRELEAEKTKLPQRGEEYKKLLVHEKELLAERDRVEAWVAEGRAATQKHDQAKVDELKKRPEAVLFNEWKRGAPKNSALETTQKRIAELQPGHRKFLQLEEQLTQLKQPYLDEAAAKQDQLKKQALDGLMRERDALFAEVTRLKNEHDRENTDFLAPFKGQLHVVEQTLVRFRKSLPVYDEESCSGKEKTASKKLKKISTLISESLKGTGSKAVAARANLQNRDFDPSLVRTELEKRLKDVEDQIKAKQDRITKVGSFELNMALVEDRDSYGRQKESFIYLSTEDLEPGNEAKLAEFKRKIREELVNGQYCYTKPKNESEPPLYVVGEETLTLERGVRGKGFGSSNWSKMLHGSEFFKGMTETGDEVYRSNEGVEVVHPTMGFDKHRRSSETEDYQYEDGDMKLEFLVG